MTAPTAPLGPAPTAEARLEALARAERDPLQHLADAILATGVDVEVAAGPETVTAPVRVRVPGTGPAAPPTGGSRPPSGTEATAVLGHVALTTATVRLAGARGDGVRPGRDLTGAIAAAVCDAEVERGGPLSAAVLALCEVAVVARTTEAARRAALVDATRLAEDA